MRVLGARHNLPPRVLSILQEKRISRDRASPNIIGVANSDKAVVPRSSKYSFLCTSPRLDARDSKTKENSPTCAIDIPTVNDVRVNILKLPIHQGDE